MTASKFKGIYVFNGGNGSALHDNPSIAGTYLGFYWAQIEKTPGVYDWSVVEQALAPWIAAGKKVILRISTCAWKKWQPSQNSGHATPQWVYATGVGHVVETDGSVKPQYWHPHFLSAFNDFIKAFAAKYDGNPHIAAIEMGIGDGGETKPDTLTSSKNRLQLWHKVGYTDKLWWTTIQTIISYYKAAFVHSQLVLMPDATFLEGKSGLNEHTVVHYAVAQGIGLQNNGLVKGQVQDPVWLQSPMIIEEQRNPVSISGDTLDADLSLGIANGATYILCFLSDLQDPKNQATLQKYAAMAAKG